MNALTDDSVVLLMPSTQPEGCTCAKNEFSTALPNWVEIIEIYVALKWEKDIVLEKNTVKIKVHEPINSWLNGKNYWSNSRFTALTSYDKLEDNQYIIFSLNSMLILRKKPLSKVSLHSCH